MSRLATWIDLSSCLCHCDRSIHNPLPKLNLMNDESDSSDEDTRLNSAYTTFRSELTLVRLLTMSLGGAREGSIDQLAERIDQEISQHSTSKPSPRISQTCGTSSISGNNTVLSIYKHDIDLMRHKIGDFKSQTYALLFTEVYRLFESYLLDFYVEIACATPRILISSETMMYKDIVKAGTYESIISKLAAEKRKKLSDGGYAKIRDSYESIGLDFIPNLAMDSLDYRDDLEKTLLNLTALRNIIEHNRSIVDDKFLNIVKHTNYSSGDRVNIKVGDINEAAWAVDCVATLLNASAAAKFPDLHIDPEDVLPWLDPLIDANKLIVKKIIYLPDSEQGKENDKNT